MDKSRKNFWDIFFKSVRVASIPPVSVAALMLVLFFAKRETFSSVWQLIAAVTLLAVLPVMSYPFAHFTPRLREQGRAAQRKTAFIFSLAGYSGAFIYGVFARVSAELMMIFATYLFSAALLALFNKLTPLRASGHACSITGPVVLTGCFFGWLWLAVGAACYALIFFSSLKLKRHTPAEFITGTLICLTAFSAAWMIYM